MSEVSLAAIRDLLAQCTAEELAEIFRDLRKRHRIHEFEDAIGAPAEMILEAVHRAPELTRRMLRGVIADAAFRQFTVAELLMRGWNDVTPEGNYAFDYKLDDGKGPVSVQVKLQRSAKGAPVVKPGTRYGFGESIHIVETQKTRTGTDKDDNKTRPYRYGEFDILAVSMQPSSAKWDRFMYTLGRWLLPGKAGGEMATLQPVSLVANEFWTDDFSKVADWHRSEDGGKRMCDSSRRLKKRVGRPAKKRAGKKKNRNSADSK